MYVKTESKAKPLATNINITGDGNNEIKTKPPKNVPNILPAEFKADRRPTTAPEEFTSCIASRATNGDTIPSSKLAGAKIITLAMTLDMYKFSSNS